MNRLPPLSLYVHVPWCVRKCPYCDFNSHASPKAVDERVYVDALLADLEAELPLVGERSLTSIFIGGGTPSLFSAEAIGRLLTGVGERLPLAADVEITLEANPGTAEAARFRGYREAGVNRLSLGVQSFGDDKLQALGRIHSAEEARAAAAMARAAGFDNFNLDLMFGLPGQSGEEMLEDLRLAVAESPTHISWYQLTLEPNTPFAHAPPELPDADRIAGWQQEGQAWLAARGYHQYEVSAYARADRECRHNLNYWRFGDYLGLGAGAHGKLSLRDGRILRRWKQRHPRAYLSAQKPFLAGDRELQAADLPLEFLMNALRLNAGVEAVLFEARTGLPLSVLEPGLDTARQRSLLATDPEHLVCTARGHRFLDDLLELFVPD